MQYSRKLPYLLVFVFLSRSIYPQAIKFPDYLVQTGAVFSVNKQTPFWLISNQYGLITPDKYNGWIRLGFKTKLSPAKNLDYDYNIDVIDRQSYSNKLYLHEIYVRLKLYFVNFQAGSMEEKFGDQDSSLSSGGLLWSGNARPMPKVTVVVPNYTSVPFTGRYIEFKGGLSHGWFEDNEFVKNSWLHHKYIYLQLGGRLPVHIHYGFHHFAQWGGESTNLTIGKMPRSFRDFLRILFAKQGGNDANISEQLNALGNHLGSRNFGLDAEFAKIKLGIYWQTIIEDSSGMRFRNIRDGLFGIYIHSKEKNRLLNGFVYEFINTKDQSGPSKIYYLLNGKYYSYPVPGSIEVFSGGNNNYFNHGIYQSGWTFHEMVIGTPLITSPAIFSGNQSGIDYIMNNRVTAHHFGLEGKYRDLQYKFLFTYYLNYGTRSFPLETTKQQYSLLLDSQINNKLPWGINLSLAIGIDHGEFYGNNAGFRLTLSKKGTFR